MIVKKRMSTISVDKIVPRYSTKTLLHGCQVLETPTADYDIANKEYADDHSIPTIVNSTTTGTEATGSVITTLTANLYLLSGNMVYASLEAMNNFTYSGTENYYIDYNNLIPSEYQAGSLVIIKIPCVIEDVATSTIYPAEILIRDARVSISFMEGTFTFQDSRVYNFSGVKGSWFTA